MIRAAEVFWDNPVFHGRLWEATAETVLMMVFTTLVVAALGLPLGVLLHSTSAKGLTPTPAVYRIVSFIVDIGRSIPFIILMIALIPFTRFVVGSALGWQATVVPLAVGAIPFFGRMVQNALREVDAGKIEAVQMMGATRVHITFQVLIREALPAIVGALTVTVVTLISYTAMAGTIGGGGLGALAIDYGYRRYQSDTMVACIVLLVALVALMQWIGDTIVKKIDHR
ncbi:methionine ABC transporter permease [Microbacterium amylolyticum]|uniref:D-methionine transport system permease protein n=1 Tax=Microbacterium amylolyticum TaxID=936337 RepID=A0ABS4ZII3_9MICO|nr:methionine ABC transporter permease [Microbacterium amylolyticum]MBP2436838.1 D-methionine transport system permease protein [Microbacterium amylolyticum]